MCGRISYGCPVQAVAAGHPGFSIEFGDSYPNTIRPVLHLLRDAGLAVKVPLERDSERRAFDLYVVSGGHVRAL